MGKIIGGGLPVGAFGGKKIYGAYIAPAGDIYQAGTLSGNPLAMAAGVATLRKLKNCDYTALEKGRPTLPNPGRYFLRGKGVDVQMPTIASMFSPFFCSTPVANFAEAQKATRKIFASFTSKCA